MNLYFVNPNHDLELLDMKLIKTMTIVLDDWFEAPLKSLGVAFCQKSRGSGVWHYKVRHTYHVKKVTCRA